MDDVVSFLDSISEVEKRLLMLEFEELAQMEGFRNFALSGSEYNISFDKELLIESKADQNEVLKNDGSVGLTGDWDIGNSRMIQADKIRARDGDGLALYEDGGAGIFVQDGGYVGVNTVTPDRRMEILDASHPQLRLTHTDGTVFTDMFTEGNGYFLLNSSSGYHVIGANAPLGFPNEKLFVGGSVVVFSNGNNPLIAIGDDGANYGKIAYNSSGDYLLFQSYGGNVATKLILNPEGGNVGIGMTSPAVKFAVAIAGDGNIARFYSNDSVLGFRIYGANDTYGGLTSHFGIDGTTERIRLSAESDCWITSQLGLDNVAPAYQLDMHNSGFDGIVISSFSTSSDVYGSPIFVIRKSHNATKGTLTTTVDGERLGSISFTGVESGGAWRSGAGFRVTQKGAAGANFVPSEMIFSACDNNDVLFLASNARVGIWTGTPEAVLSINGGVHIGGDSDPGNDNLLVDGTFKVVGNSGFYNTAPVAQPTGIAAQKINYTAGDLDTEAEIISAINTTNTAINALRTALNALGLTTTV